MYQTPKAIHFSVKENGEEINTEEALALKWSVAKGLGNIDMLRLTDDQFQAIGRACNKLNNGMLSKIGFTIELRNA
jgi:hypothetical protein